MKRNLLPIFNNLVWWLNHAGRQGGEVSELYQLSFWGMDKDKLTNKQQSDLKNGLTAAFIGSFAGTAYQQDDWALALIDYFPEETVLEFVIEKFDFKWWFGQEKTSIFRFVESLSRVKYSVLRGCPKTMDLLFDVWELYPAGIDGLLEGTAQGQT